MISVERDGHIATLTIQRPDKLNALNPEVLAALDAALRDLDTRCAILTGAGRAFVAGADIAAMAEMRPEEARRFSESGQRLCAAMEQTRFPIIAAVNGFALGGGLELALACDFIFASDKAKLGQPEVTLGVIPGFGGTQRLARRVGLGHARELVYTGALIGADEALRIGLVNRVVPTDQLLDAARETARAIAGVAPLAVNAGKRVLLRGEGMSLEAACELETQAFAALFGSDDQRTGMAAFLAKEKPTFTGR
ncbi:MAG TPA: enoyl-CoA hydratase-related protein [Polyangiaceae bacterium]|nr:enoyl-CoA hydratase-related protein [Polyangiaceae bacterium]